MKHISLLLLFLAGCHIQITDTAKRQTSPVEVKLVRGAGFTGGHSGYDPVLQGYHLTGGIGTIMVHSRDGRTPSALALSITTTPSMRPNLEGITITCADTVIQASPSAESGEVDVMLRRPDGSVRTISRAKQERFLEYRVERSAVVVTFAGAALEMMKQECTISWVDWFRH